MISLVKDFFTVQKIKRTC